MLESWERACRDVMPKTRVRYRLIWKMG